MDGGPAEIAKAYKEGYVEGARAIVKAIGDDLPEAQMRVLQAWVERSLVDWQGAGPDAAKPQMPMIDGA